MPPPENIKTIAGKAVNVQIIQPGESVEIEISSNRYRKYTNTSNSELWYISPHLSWTDAYAKVQNTLWYNKWIATRSNEELRTKCMHDIEEWQKTYEQIFPKPLRDKIDALNDTISNLKKSLKDTGITESEINKQAREKHAKLWGKLRLTRAQQKLWDEQPSMTSCIDEYTYVTGISDPFEIRKLTSFVSRYVTTLSETFYPDHKEYHVRGFHYRLQEHPIAWFKGGKGHYYLTIYGGNPDAPHYKDQNDDHYNDLGEGVKLARFAGFIPMEQILEKRIVTGVKPDDPGIVPYLTNRTFDVKLHAEITPIKDFKLEYNVPLIFLFSEKSELEPIFAKLAERYFLCYFIGAGEISPTNVRDIYEYIKKYATTSIILTFTDFDPSGVIIPTNFARKLQWFIENDSTNAPSIIMYPFAVNEHQLAELKQANVRPILRKYEIISEEPLKVYELDALDVLAERKGKSLLEYFDEELRQLLPILTPRQDGKVVTWQGTLFPKTIATSLLNTEYERLRQQLTNNLSVQIDDIRKRLAVQLPQEKVDEAFEDVRGWKDADDYAKLLLDGLRTSPAFKALEIAGRNTVFDPQDIRVEKPEFNPAIDINKEAILPPSIESKELPTLPKLALITKHINELRKRKREAIETATRSEVKQAEKVEAKAMPG